MAKTTAEKLLIKPDTTLWVSTADRAILLGPFPAGVTMVDSPAAATTAVVFVDDERSLNALLDDHGTSLAAPSVVWFAYPKGGRSDINRDSLWPIVAERTKMRPITQIALDETWSALRFRPLRPDEEPFAPRQT